jgi:O-antigen/teichoic acid export membrane protein
MNERQVPSVAAAREGAYSSPSRARLKRAGVVAGRNSLFMVLAQVGGKLAALLLFLALVRTLTVAEIGQFSFATTFVGVFTLLTDWGLSTWMMREVARHRTNVPHRLGTALCAKGITFTVSATAGLSIAWITHLPPSTWSVVLILFLAMAPDGLAQTLAYSLLALERGGASSLIICITDWLRLGFVCLLLYIAPKLLYVAWAHVFAAWLCSLLVVLYLARYGIRLIKPSVQDLKTALRCGFPFLLVGIAVRIYLRADTLLLAYLRTDVSVGVYNAAYKPMEALMFIPGALMGALFPLLSRTFGRDMGHFRAGCHTAIRLLSMIGLPLAVGTTLIAPQLIAWFYGPQYGRSVLYLRVLIWATALVFINSTLATSLNASGREKYGLTVVAIGVFVNIVGNVILIRFLDALGAAIMTVVTELLSTVLYLRFFRRFLFHLDIPSLIWRPTAASAFMGGVVLCAPSYPLPARIAVGVVSYCLSLALLGGLRRDEGRLALAVLGIRR